MLKGNDVGGCNLCRKALCEACVQRLGGVSSVTELSDSACVCVSQALGSGARMGEACGEPQNEAFIRELCKASNDF